MSEVQNSTRKRCTCRGECGRGHAGRQCPAQTGQLLIRQTLAPGERELFSGVPTPEVRVAQLGQSAESFLCQFCATPQLPLPFEAP